MSTTRATDDWRQIARGADPLYSIASVPGKEGAWTPEDFYAHGAADWAEFRRHWVHYDPGLGGTCLEIGCGGGRLTSALAKDFEQVVAVDVSADMIERARGVTGANVDFRQTDGVTLPAEDASVDHVFSIHVIQHLERWEDVVRYIAETRRVLRPGGSVLIHIMLRGSPTRVREHARETLKLWRSRRALKRGREHSTIRTNTYWIDDVYRMFVDAGFEELEQRMITTGDYGHQCWLAKAPAG